MSLTASFVGTWRLVSYVAVDSAGRTRPYWDDHPLGQLVYTTDGNMSAQVYDAPTFTAARQTRLRER